MDKDIAIIGMSGRFPEAASLEAFFQNLAEGKDSIRMLSEDRIKHTTLAKGRQYKPFAYLEDIDCFDHDFFGISYGEAKYIDPHQRLILEVAYQAMADAGYSLKDMNGSDTSIYIGDTAQNYYRLAEEYDPAIVTGNLNAATAGRVARAFNLRGTAMMVDTACSSSLVALQLACNDLILGNCSQALVGAVKLFLFPDEESEENGIGITSGDGKTRSFSADATGTGLGEAVCSVMLKPLDKAREDNDRVYAVIKGMAANQDGQLSANLSAPDSVAQSEVLLKAWKKAGINPEALGYIEAHGTATNLGDPIEAKGLNLAFSRVTNRKQFCALSALKSNIGHTDTAAGLAGLIKAALSLYHKKLLPTLHFSEPNHFIDFIGGPVYINRELKDWPAQDLPRQAGVSSFGISGTNVHVVLEEAKLAPFSQENTARLAFPFSAKNPEALQHILTDMGAFLIGNQGVNLNDLSYTLSRRRTHFPNRVAVAASSVAELVDKLKSKTIPEEEASPAEKLFFTFSGSGVVEEEYLREFLEDDSFREAYHKCLAGSAENENLRLFAFQYALYHLMLSQGIRTKFLMGEGIGELVVDAIQKESKLSVILKQVETYTGETDPALSSRLEKFLSANADGSILFVEMAPRGTIGHILAGLSEKSDNAAVLLPDEGRAALQAGLFEQGFDVDFTTEGNVISLPPYPFIKNRCWIKDSHRGEVEAWLHRFAWTPQALTEAPEPISGGTFLLFEDEEGLSDRLAVALESHGNTCLKVSGGITFEQNGPSFVIRPESEEDYTRLAKEIADQEITLDGIIHAGSFRTQTGLQSENLEENLLGTVYSLFFIAKAFHHHLQKGGFRFVAISSQAEAVHAGEEVSLSNAMSGGFLRSLLSDYPQLSVSGIDIGAAITGQQAADYIIDEIGHEEQIRFSAYREHTRYVPLIAPVTVQENRDLLVFQSEETYLVTGGAAGIGHAIARYIAAQAACTLIIIGRTDLGYGTEWKNGPVTERKRNLQQLEEAGAHIYYYTSDLSDKSQMKLAFDQIRTDHEKIDGIAHVAGVPHRWVDLTDKTLQDFRHVMGPKVAGSLLLHEYTAGDNLRFFALFSSLNSRVPQKLSTDYTVANDFEDLFAHHLQSKGVPAVSIGWPGWLETGMSADSAKQAENDPLPVNFLTNEEGTLAFHYAISGTAANVGVADADLESFKVNPFFKIGGSTEETSKRDKGSLREELEGTEAIVAGTWNEVLQKENLSREDNFFQAGGHSLIGARIINKLNAQLGLALSFRDMYEYPTIAALSAYIESLQGNEKATAQQQTEMTVLPEQADYEVSPGQRRLWFLYRLDPYGSSYNIPAEFEIGEKADPEIVQKALSEVINRHESLRTTFRDQDGEPRQVIHSSKTVRWKLKVDNIHTEDDPEAAYHRLSSVDLQTPFDLEHGPLFRARLIHTQAHSSLLMLTLHHVIADGISLEILKRDLHEAYAALKAGHSPGFSPLPLQYKEYAAWVNRRLADDHDGLLRKYWLNKLSGQLSPLDLPFDYPLRNAVTNRGAMFRTAIPSEVLEPLKKLAERYSTSLFTVLISGFSILLQRICNQKDIIIGTPVAGRNHEELQGLVGFFLNTVMLRVAVDDQGSFENHLKAVRQTVMDGLDHQEYPFEKIVAELDVPRDINRFPVSSVFFNMMNYSEEEARTIDLFDSFHRPLDIIMNFDIDFYAYEYTNGLEFHCMYKQELFSRETISYLVEEYINLLSHAIQSPLTPVGQLNGLAPVKNTQATGIPELPYEPILKVEGTLVSHFEEFAAATPNAIALSMDGSRMTYKELNEAANRLAYHIQENEVGQQKTIALLVGHSIEMIVALLAVLKSGNAYVPLDPMHPASRLKFILSDAECEGIISDDQHNEYALQIGGGLPVWNIKDVPPSTPSANPGIDISRESRAYILYTSGSTGTPKGVVQWHRNVLHFISAYTNNLRISSADRLSLLPVYSFDAAVMDICAALLNGATLCPYDMRGGEGLYGLSDFLQVEKITVLHMVPTLFRQWAGENAASAACETVRLVVLGGEACLKTDFDYFRSFFPRTAYFVNGLGPTESTVTLQYIVPYDTTITLPKMPVGYPVEDTIAAVIREDGSEACTYESGELVFKSHYLSPGYQNASELTAAAFTHQENGLRTYRTGDFAKKLPDGKIIFEGRKDKQLKVNGNRVEAGEVEAAIRRYLPACKDCVFTVDNKGGSDRLIAYLVADGVNTSVLQGRLREALPPYMIPALFIFLDKLPVNLNGKVDHKKLPEPATVAAAEGGHIAPVTDMEKRVAALFASLTGKEKAGATDSFFAIGGDSLKAMKLVSRLRKELEADIDLKEIFTHPEVRSLAAYLESAGKGRFVIDPAPERALYPVVPEQKSIWLEDRLKAGQYVNHLMRIFHFEGDIDMSLFNKALKAVVDRHEILRTTFVFRDNELYQKIHPTEAPLDVLSQVDLRSKEDDLDAVVGAAFHERMDMETGPLWRIVIIRLDAQRFVIVLVLHHIIADRKSIEILFEELSTSYLKMKEGTQMPLKPLDIQFKDYVEWYSRQVSGAKGESMKNFWRQYLGDEPDGRNNLADRSPSSPHEYVTKSVQIVLPRKVAEDINGLSGKMGCGPFTLLLTAVKVVLYRYTGRKNITIGTPISLRTMPGLEDQIGLYVNNPPCRTMIRGELNMTEAIMNVHHSLLQVYKHQYYPFSQILDAVRADRTPGKFPLYNTIVLYNAVDNDEKPGEAQDEQQTVNDIDITINNTIIDLRIVFTAFEGGLHVNIDYNNALFSEELMTGFKDAIEYVIGSILADPYITINNLELGSQAEQPAPAEGEFEDQFDFDF
ncbi:amino acid adenylation domain-containing protein [Roseivirga sp. BDSF3-8]|uniref:type I polyketide synthase n=1 Tax=Roseivirga sp. BDSF3-8 TaxID=3241598 RepID=UPI003531F4E3